MLNCKRRKQIRKNGQFSGAGVVCALCVRLLRRGDSGIISVMLSLGLPFFERWPTMPPLQARHPARRNAADGWLTDRGRGLMAIQAAAESTDKRAEPTHHGRSPQRLKCRARCGWFDLIGSPRQAAASDTKAKHGGVCRWRAGSLTVCPSRGFPRSA